MPIPKRDANHPEPFSEAHLALPDGQSLDWENPYKPSIDAEKYHRSEGRRILGGGARGGGKTRANVEDVITKMLKYPGIPILFGRKDFKDIKSTAMHEFLLRCPEWLYARQYGGQYHQTDHFVRFLNGSRVDFVELKDVESHRSRNLGAVYLEEAHEIPRLENVVSELGGALRWTTEKGKCKRESCYEDAQELADYEGKTLADVYEEHAEHPIRQIKMTSNPHGGWLKRTFFTPWKEGRLPRGYEYHPFSVFNNPGVDRSYINDMMKGTSERWRRNFIYGDWDIFENLAYPLFNRSVHIWKGPAPYDQFVDVRGGIDWGHPGLETAHKTAIYLTGRLRSGVLITFFEHVSVGAPTKNTFALLSSLTKRHRVSRWFADGSQSIGNSRLRDAFIPVHDADRRPGAVADGVNEWNRLMELDESGHPGWYVTNDCPGLMAGLESYEMDPDTGLYIKREDDEVDGGRYNIMGFAVSEERQAQRVQVQTASANSKRDGRSSILRARQEERRARLRQFVESERYVGTHPSRKTA